MAAGSHPDLDERLATPQELADFLQKPRKTLAEWRSRGIGPTYYKIGRDVRYPWPGIRRWLADQAHGAH